MAAPYRAYTPGDAAWPVMIAGDIPDYWKPPIWLRPLTPILTPTDPNRARLRTTLLDEHSTQIRIFRAFSDMTRHPDTH